MVEAKLYIEGGGSKSKALGISFRQGWRRFFEAAEVHNIKIVHGGGREQTFRKFKRATEELSYGIVPMLLVDSESAVDEGTSAWEHLKKNDNWHCPEHAQSDQAFLMVQCMETWFLADQDTLKSFFGTQFDRNAVRQWPHLEQVPKETVYGTLKKATSKCRKPYSKGKISFELLAKTNPLLVKAACPHAAALLRRLQDL